MRIHSIFIVAFLCFLAVNGNAQKTGDLLLEATPISLLGADAEQYNNYIDQNEILVWEIYVPENYDASKPAGVMVHAGAMRNIRVPTGWKSVFNDKNMIWVAARSSGNGSSIYQKTLLAMMSVPLIEKNFNIDKNRILITGEGRTAARTILNYPEKFNGALLVGNGIWEDNAEEKINGVLHKRFLFSNVDSNLFATNADSPNNFRRGTYHAYRNFKKLGVINLFQLRGNLKRRNFEKVIDYFDGEELPKRLTRFQ